MTNTTETVYKVHSSLEAMSLWRICLPQRGYMSPSLGFIEANGFCETFFISQGRVRASSFINAYGIISEESGSDTLLAIFRKSLQVLIITASILGERAMKFVFSL